MNKTMDVALTAFYNGIEFRALRFPLKNTDNKPPREILPSWDMVQIMANGYREDKKQVEIDIRERMDYLIECELDYVKFNQQGLKGKTGNPSICRVSRPIGI